MDVSSSTDYRQTIAATMSGTTDYIDSAMPSVSMVMDGYYKTFKTETCHYFETVLNNLQKVHQESFDKREAELYHQISELQGQVLDLQDQLSNMTDKCKMQEETLEKYQDLAIQRHFKKYRTHSSPWALKKIFLAWKNQTKKSKQCTKTDKFLASWEKRHYCFKYLALLNAAHRGLKCDHTLTEAKFKYETLSNEVSSII